MVAVDAAEADGERPPRRRRLAKLLASTAVTEVIMATIAHTGETSPVVAAGIPIPLKLNANTRFCFVFR